jgi:membrane protein DedA with SNARE-associated domain
LGRTVGLGARKWIPRQTIVIGDRARAVGIADLIGTYGYPLVFAGAIVEGETVLIVAGYLAHGRGLDVTLVATFAAAGGALGDVGCFLIGRLFGERVLLMLPAWARAGAIRMRSAVERRPVRVLLVMRFLYGMRIALPALCGASTMKMSKFLRYDLATAILWSVVFTAIGYAFGAAATAAIHEIGRYQWLVVCAIVAIGLLLHRASKPLRRLVIPTDP